MSACEAMFPLFLCSISFITFARIWNCLIALRKLFIGMVWDDIASTHCKRGRCTVMGIAKTTWNDRCAAFKTSLSNVFVQIMRRHNDAAINSWTHFEEAWSDAIHILIPFQFLFYPIRHDYILWILCFIIVFIWKTSLIESISLMTSIMQWLLASVLRTNVAYLMQFMVIDFAVKFVIQHAVIRAAKFFLIALDFGL